MSEITNFQTLSALTPPLPAESQRTTFLFLDLEYIFESYSFD